MQIGPTVLKFTFVSYGPFTLAIFVSISVAISKSPVLTTDNILQRFESPVVYIGYHKVALEIAAKKSLQKLSV